MAPKCPLYEYQEAYHQRFVQELYNNRKGIFKLYVTYFLHRFEPTTKVATILFDEPARVGVLPTDFVEQDKKEKAEAGIGTMFVKAMLHLPSTIVAHILAALIVATDGRRTRV